MISSGPRTREKLVITCGLLALALVAYGPLLWSLVERWMADNRYYHGFLVPLLGAAVLVGRRRILIDPSLQAPCFRIALALLLLSLALGVTGLVLDLEWFGQVSMLPGFAGVVSLLFGRAGLRWCWPVAVFLVFMIPLPYRLEEWLAAPLQDFTALGSAWLLQVLGYGAVAQGNVVLMENDIIRVVEACSGPSMLMSFMILAAVLALVMDKPAWERALVLLSGLPIAFVTNVARIAAVAILRQLGGYTAHLTHDLPGWIMLPFAATLLAIELWLFRLVLVEGPSEERLAEERSAPSGVVVPGLEGLRGD